MLKKLLNMIIERVKKWSLKKKIIVGFLIFWIYCIYCVIMGNIRAGIKEGLKANQETITPTKTVIETTIKPTETKSEEEIKKEKEEKAEKDYQTWIDSQFSAWDGSNLQLKNLVKLYMNDSDSFKHIATYYTVKEDMQSVDITMTFSGTNQFGGTVKNTVRGTLLRDGNKIEDFETIE